MHIQRHTHTSTNVQSAHKRNGDNQAQEPGWERRKKGFVRDLAHTQKKMSRKTDIHESKEKIRAHKAAKLLDYFLRSNKSNINQSIQRKPWRIHVNKWMQNILHIYAYIHIDIKCTQNNKNDKKHITIIIVLCILK